MERIMDEDECSDIEVIRCLDYQNDQRYVEMESGSTIVCQFSLASLKRNCVFTDNQLVTFSHQSWSFDDKQHLLNKLAEWMLDHKKGLCIAKHFCGIILEILTRTQVLVRRDSGAKQLNHLKFSLTLSHLLPSFPNILSFVIRYFKEFGPFFGQRIKPEECVLVMEISYRFLSFSPMTFRELWNWGMLCEANYLRNDKTKRFFVKAMSIVLNCNNREIVELFGNDQDMCNHEMESEINEVEGNCCDGKVEYFTSNTQRNDVGNDLTIEKANAQSNIYGDNSGVQSFEMQDTEMTNKIVFNEQDFCELHMITANMLIPRISKANLSSEGLVEVPSMRKNIEALSVALVSGRGILLSGGVGSGKTSLVEHFAGLTGRDKPPYLFKVQLGDQTDSKALIGSYCCSDAPGEFVWRPGILTRAVKEGRWLLLEDIDCAPMDVISVLIPLLESRVLTNPGKENIPAASGFQLFATQRVGGVSRRSNSESSLLEHLWSKIHIEPLTKNELEEIVVVKFPNLKALASKLVDTFSLLSSDLQLTSKPDTRRLSADKRLSTVRDFMKWCRRINSLSNAGATLLSSQDILQEAMDCFCATISNIEHRLFIALAIGAKLNINKVKVDFVCSIYKPDLKVAPLCFTVGRVTLNRELREEVSEKPNFAFTRHSLTLLESLAVCVSQNEPVLLVGETGTGKTSAIQYLAALCNRSLVVINMSQQSDSTDLIGGFKPMEMKQLVAPVREDFENLFCQTFSRKQNVQFLSNIQQCYGKRKWEVLFKVMLHAQQAAVEKLSKDTSISYILLSLWKKVGQRIQRLRQQLKHAESAQMFSFVEGALVKAIKSGHWVLLDEINLATPDTLECLNGVLESQQGSVVVLERGDAEPIVRHEEFRMFACMNPANDVGKKDLPAGIRNRFTEMFVHELQDIPDLKTLVFSYLQGLSPPAPFIDGIVSFYLVIREEAGQKLTDGSGNRPYYSLRTLCRALKLASRNLHGNLLRSLYESFCTSFLTQLDRSSHKIVESLLQEKLLGHVTARGLLNQPLRKPVLKNENFLNFEGYWVCQGNIEPTRSSEYVFTASVKDNLKCLARIVSGRNFPVLIQGETSVGKTSLINWLAKASGNYCVRINNHEHTDIQEYLGCYTSDNSGKLVFKEGILVDAMRKGYWIILDELNLAPTDVLEALNRLLDDNRELFIPEIQETVKAHPKFMLFATQNPPGHYGGRKVLSRAFRNRFVELHFEELPSKELETILHKRCSLPLSYSKTLVNIMLELQIRRRGSTVFSGKHGYITLRDLFRWADRYSKSQDVEGTFFDWNQQLAEDGYFLLAGRCRNSQETLVVQEVIQKHMKRKINVHSLFGHPSTEKLSSFSEKILRDLIDNCPEDFDHVVFTYNMRRLAVLVARALQFNEPVLLVGETGCGKTTICQIFAAVQKRKLYAVNCHLHTETSDFLGGLRPARRGKNSDQETSLRLFEWCDGSLVLAMKGGCMFLADEISLADDSVLERLNSVLEPERTLILAEKGSSSDHDFQQDIDLIVAKKGFQLLATMNPGGDYGKKELSPALRNRFTEIWCPANDNPEDMIAIIEHNISPGITLKPQTDGASGIGNAMIEFIEWFKQNNFAKRCVVTIRDFLSWVKFICSTTSANNEHKILSPSQAYYHGAFLVFLDALGLGTMKNSQNTSSARDACAQFLHDQIKDYSKLVNDSDSHNNGNVMNESMETNGNKIEMFTFGNFSIPKGPESSSSIHNEYALNAPTTYGNAERVMRAMQLHRPILLEGSPGVGKTSLVSALAKASGYRLVRINLSEQTDISDLFGADLPVEGGQGCQFSWCDGPLLLALKSGSWIVLDELNLASQSVLEGLNACFDHRGEIFIPELGMSFKVQHERTKFFACQNPLNQGGGRKGLPKSFLNRFTQVFVEPLTHGDLLFITQAMYPTIHRNTLQKMITFNSQVYQRCVVEGLCSKHGGSWEFNLRDIFRWCDLMIKYQNASYWNPMVFVQLIYAGRMRQDVCRNQVWELCSSVFGQNSARVIGTLVHATPSNIQVGQCLFPKSKSHMQDGTFQIGPLYILHRTLKPLESLLTCLKMNWLALLVGPKSSGKSSLARLAAKLTGTKLDIMAMNSSIDTTELLGGYEQADLERQQTEIKVKVKEEIFNLCKNLLLLEKFDNSFDDIKNILSHWFAFGGNDVRNNCSGNSDSVEEPSTMLDNISQLSKLIDEASRICQRHNFADYNIEQLKVQVTRLHAELVKSNGNSHVSGQFEWVDGQLVKALKNGHWLLIDNVNFCSPSVLDRLNGLLEPGGELSINERGVVDGDIPVVKPHPDFRLIFAMDSKHGEISRAMRNRGVEIFLMQQDSDADDLCSMLYSSGCRNTTAVQTLIDFHNQNKQDSLLQTIHMGSLIGELLQRGIELERSLVLSLNHVNSRTPFPFQKEDEMDQKKSIEKKPSARNFQKNSISAMISWHSMPLKRIIKIDRKSSNDVKTAIIIFLEWCSKKDWLRRLQRLKHLLSHSVNMKEEFTCELNVLEFCLQRLFQSEAAKLVYNFYEDLETKFGDCNLDASHQPVNIRVNGPLYDYILCKINSDDKMSGKYVSHTNRVYLLWTFFILEAKQESCLNVVRKTYLKMPLSLSFAFAKGDVKAENLPHEGIAHIYPLMHSFQECVRNFLQNRREIINDNIAYKIWVSLKQQKQFLDVCTKCYHGNENYHILFDLHWKFFSSGPLATICEILNKSPHEIDAFQELLSVKKCLDDICKYDEELASCHWKMIDAFEHPTVFLFEELCLLWARIGKLFADINPDMNVTESISQKRASQVELLKDMVSLIQLREGRVREVEAQNILGRIKENINKIKQNHESNETMDQSSSDVLTTFAAIAIIDNTDGELPENMTEVFNSGIFQDYCKIVANSAYTECINFLTSTSLHQKLIDSKTNFPNSILWSEKLRSYNDFCVKYLREVPPNIAWIQYLLRNDPPSDDVFRNLTVKKYEKEQNESNITCSNLNNKCFVKTFEALSFQPEQRSFSIPQDRSQICLVDVTNKITEYKHFTTFLWLHQNYFSKLETKQFAIDSKSIFLAFLRLLHCWSAINESSEFTYSNILNLSNVLQISDEICQNVENYINDLEECYNNTAHGIIDTHVVKDCFLKVLHFIRTLGNTDTEKEKPSKVERKIQLGKCWVYLGMIQSTILRPFGNVDPVEEKNVKIDQLKNEIIDVSSELKVRSENEELLSGATMNESVTLQVNPSHVRNLIQYQGSLKSEISDIGNDVAYRPVPSQFRGIIGLLQHFSTSITSYSKTMKIIDDACRNTEPYAKRRRGIVHLKTWIKSIEKFTLQLQDFVAYQDILGAYISGLLQSLQGTEMIISAVESKLKWIKYKEIIQAELIAETYLPQEIVSCVLPFSCFNSMSTRVERLLSEEMSRGIEALCQTNSSTITGVDWKEESGRLKSRIRMLALNILEQSVCRAGYTTPNDIQNLTTVVNCYKTLWLFREEERKLQEEEDNSLYKFKTKSYCSDEDSDEQQDQKEVEKLFTRFDEEYKDLQLEENMDSRTKKKKEIVEGQSTVDAILENDMSEFFKIHHFLVSSSPNVCELLSTLGDSQWKGNDTKLKEIQIAYDGYNIAADVVRIADLCDEDLPDNPTQDHLLASSILLRSLHACESGSSLQEQLNIGPSSVLFQRKNEEYDIYHNSNLKEIIQVLPILKSFKSRLQQLLEEWPDHPTLVQLCQTIERIESFQITSPVMKILNGLEILLKHSQEWESNASRHVSIRAHLDQITQKIIQWRQLELSCWSSLLLVCETKVREKANHWWFHIAHVIQQFSEPEDSGLTDFTEFINVLQQFIERSPLGEFSERLKILVSFCNQKTVEHVQNRNSGIVRTILQNIYRYYQQFEPHTESLIHKAKAPIKKELKDFIKIVKWKDINYWAMKETSSRSHYTLLKLMKKYQRALSEGIDGVLTSSGQVISCEDPGENNGLFFEFELTRFLSPINLRNLDLSNSDEGSQRPPVQQMFEKMRKLTQKKLNVLRYKMLSESVDKLTSEIVETTHSLQKLEVGDKTGKERTQFCKHIHVLKKRALADLFKGLKKLGLSYRKGIRLRQQNYLKDPMMVDCDVLRSLRNVLRLFDNNTHPSFLPLLENGMNYYQKCVARSAVMNNVLSSPSKDLTVGDVDRMKGFVEHLREITQRQRENISTIGKSFSELSLVVGQLKKIMSGQPSKLPPQRKMAEWTLKLDEILDISLETSNKLLCLLDTCPDSKIDTAMSPVPDDLSNLSKCCKQDSSYVCLSKATKKFHEDISKIKSKIYLQTIMLYPLGSVKENDTAFLATWTHFESLESSFVQLEETLLHLDEFVKIDASCDALKDSINYSNLGCGKLAFHLRERIAKTCQEFTGWSKGTFKETHDDIFEDHFSPFRSKMMSTRESILVSFQKWYKRKNIGVNETRESIVTVEDEDEKYFVEGLDNELMEDISILNIQERTRNIKTFVTFLRQEIDKQYENYNGRSIQTLCEIMMSILPCLSQYVLLVEYHFHHLLLCHRISCKLQSVLLGIFSELLQKGFCLPPDMEETGGEGATSFGDAENCGIGEGDGMKDVSDQIEDEEQLLGGEQEKSEQKEGDKSEIPDEEHGIEMSEDFDGETHDVEKDGEGSDTDGESEDEKDNLEQQMGDVDGAEETLDEKLWADSDGEDDDNDKTEGMDERGTGADGEDRSEMVAKEENLGSSKENKSKPKEENTEDEINELRKDEDDQGNLDDDISNARDELKSEDLQPEDMNLADDLDLDTQENDGEVGDGDSEFGEDNDEVEHGGNDEDEDGKDEVDNVSNNDTEENDLQMKEEAETVEEINKQEQENDQTDLEKDEDNENNGRENDWRTESETKGENVESVENEGNPDASTYGTSASSERCDPTVNEESMSDGNVDGTHNSMSLQSGLESTDNSTTCKTQDLASTETTSHRKQLNKSRADRSLGSADESACKKQRVLDSSDNNSVDNQRQNTASSADLFEHLRNDDELHDIQVYDAATAEQQKQQETVNYPTETEEQDGTENMDGDWELPPEDKSRTAEQKVEKSERSSHLQTDKTQGSPEDNIHDNKMSTEEDQDEARSEWQDTASSVFVGRDPVFVEEQTEAMDLEKCRHELEELLCKWRDQKEGSPEEQATALDTWHKYEQLTSTHSQQLCEQLRIVLEPSIANKLRGDYRTGKRLNMRKVIPYIASQYRKDKIWLRRTKKSKRQYQILLAIDDSSSMSDNKSKQLAFESLAVITNALTRLEVGEIAICSFGEDVQLLHPFHETFTEPSGANILRQFRFEQKKTKIAQLLDSCTSVMTSARSRINKGNDVSQLLLIVSDGRGIFLEGVETVQKAVRKAREAGIFLVFVILDNPTNKDSVFDIKVPIFRPNQLPELKSYIEQFPFPFYIVLRDTSSLPETLSDSLRQWFELVTNIS